MINSVFMILNYKYNCVWLKYNITLFKIMESKVVSQPKSMSRSIFIESLVGNIKEKYFFEKKLGSGGYGAVYLAKNKKTGEFHI